MLFLSSPVTLQARTSLQYPDSLQPPRPDLAAIHWPNLSKLEVDVRDQITAQQNVLSTTVKDKNATSSKMSLAYGELGQTYHAYSLFDPAEKCYVNAIRLSPKDFRWVYLLARLEHVQGRADEAIGNYQLAFSLEPSFVPALIYLGNLYLELDRLKDAQASFGQALQLEPNNAAAHYGLGQVALSNRNYAEAIERLEKTLTLVPQANRIHYPLALAYRGSGNTAKAKAHLAQQGTVGVRVRDPLSDHLLELVQGARLPLVRGRQALEAKRYEEAAVQFRKAIEIDPESITGYVNLGATLNRLGDFKGAYEQFEKALRIDPNNNNAHFNLAVLLANENKHQAAVEHLRTVLRTDPNDLTARMFLARELAKSGSIDESIAEFSSVIDIDSNNEDAIVERAQLLQSKGEFKRALEGLEKAHVQYPQKAKTKLMLGFVLAASPQLDLRNGTRALKLAEELYSTDVSLQHGRLVVLALGELGRCDDAAEWQRKLIARASEEQNTELARKLKENLRLYENANSCRP
jgi:tetratricopeptide (TPR) repeat protein